MRRFASLVAVVLAVAVTAGCSSGDAAPKTAAERIEAGRETYRAVCAACHGGDLTGTAAGPSMLDPVFAPSTHPDSAFYDAVSKGVSAHGHFEKTTWGPMPALPTVDRDDTTNVIEYVRSEQAKAGVTGG